MPSFEEEAFARAQQMTKRQPFYGNNQQSQKSVPKQEQMPKKEQKPVPEKPPEQKLQNGNNSLLDMLFKNKEQSLILLLLVLLMDEKTDPTLLLALVYLLI